VPHRRAAPAIAPPQVGNSRLLRPWRLFVLLLLALVLVEVAVMTALHVAEVDAHWAIYLDPLALGAVGAVVLYWLFLRPLRTTVVNLDQARHSITQSQQFLQKVIDSVPDTMMVLATDYKIILANRKVCEAFGSDPAAQGLSCHHVSHHSGMPCTGEDDPCPHRMVMEQKRPVTVTHRHPGPNGTVQYVEVTASPILNDADQVVQVIECCRDVTQRHLAEQAVIETRNRLLATLKSIGDGVISTDADGMVRGLNKVAETLTGWTSDEATGRSVTEVLRIVNAESRETVENPVFRAIAEGRVVELANGTILIGRDGSERHIADSCAPIRGADEEIFGAVLVFRDVTTEHEQREALKTAATSDKLTGLPNRPLLLDRLQQAILRHRRTPDRRYAVLFLDFDRFKLVNDSLGHEAGDRLLVQIADRLRSHVRPADSVSYREGEATPARLGGDEFVVLLDDVASTGSALAAADRLLEALAKPYDIGDSRIVSTASLGIVTSDSGDYDRAEDVLRDADTAMYEAKWAGKGRAVLFDSAMRKRAQRRLDLENQLREAIADRQFSLYYQPIVSLETGRIASVEALVRWNHPQLGLVPPDQFIPLAEENGLIVPLGDWVLEEACRQLGRWWKTLGPTRIPSVSINLSARQFHVADLGDRIVAAAREAGVDPSAVQLEITESSVMRDVEAASALLKDLKARGFKLAMDDFGTGHSSLACLHRFPLDVIKIDRSFVANLSRGRDYAAVVHAIALLARNMHIRLVAEGVESPDIVPALQYMECQYGQGYYFSRPVPPEMIAEYQPVVLYTPS
jgi:diguanylate cyclase (GGDEF)-like protein/PAS domain S-box-containing protein